MIFLLDFETVSTVWYIYSDYIKMCIPDAKVWRRLLDGNTFYLYGGTHSSDLAFSIFMNSDSAILTHGHAEQLPWGHMLYLLMFKHWFCWKYQYNKYI
jgi:hypothetical protein